MNIEMPSPEEKKRSVAYIVDKTVTDAGIFRTVIKMMKILSVRNLFFGITDCIYIAAFTAVAALFLCSAVPAKYTVPAIFFVSPFFYIGSYVLSLFKEHICGTLEIQRVCLFTPEQLTAVRMLFLSVLGLVAEIPFMLFISDKTGGSFVRLFAVSCLSLFAYGSISILSGLFFKRMISATVQPCIWLAGLAATVASLIEGSSSGVLPAVIRSLTYTDGNILMCFAVAALVLFFLSLDAAVRRRAVSRDR